MGATFGGVMGAFFGSIESITLSIQSKFFSGIISGIIIGAFGGILGYLTGQLVLILLIDTLSYSNKMLNTIAIPISRIIGWGTLGIFIGAIDGLRTRSLNKIKVGLLGGFLGGLIGGGILEYLRVYFPDFSLGRLLGILCLGFFIGLLYSIFENYFSRGVFKLLNGPMKGKEYLLIQKKIRLGAAQKSDIYLENYKGIIENHAGIEVNGNTVVIKSKKSTHPVIVNEEPIMEHQLKFEDVIQVGNAKFLFFYK